MQYQCVLKGFRIRRKHNSSTLRSLAGDDQDREDADGVKTEKFIHGRRSLGYRQNTPEIMKIPGVFKGLF
jgi:hypothetical protein